LYSDSGDVLLIAQGEKEFSNDFGFLFAEFVEHDDRRHEFLMGVSGHHRDLKLKDSERSGGEAIKGLSKNLKGDSGGDNEGEENLTGVSWQ